MNRIIKGDRVKVISGKHKGSEGIVLQVFPKNETAIVEGVNRVKKHKKASADQEQGGIIEIEAPIRLCKLALIDPKGKGATTKIKYSKTKDKKKVRVAKKSGAEFTAK